MSLKTIISRGLPLDYSGFFVGVEPSLVSDVKVIGPPLWKRGLARGWVERGFDKRELPLCCPSLFVLVRPSLGVPVEESNPSLRKRWPVRRRLGRSMILRRRRPRRSVILRRWRPRRWPIIAGSIVAISPLLVWIYYQGQLHIL